MSNNFGRILGRVQNIALGIGAAGLLINSCLYNVGAGERGFLFDRLSGVRTTIYAPGTHLYVPILQTPVVMDVRTRPRVLSTETGTKDLQQVNISLRILSHPRPDRVNDIFREIGLDFDERVLPSIGNEILKSVVAQYNADQLLTLRDKVSAEIRAALTKRASDFHLDLDDVSITHLGFSKDFAAAIEHKQVAQQLAEKAKFVVMKAEQEKRALIIQSEGDAEAAKLVSDSVSQHGRGLIELRRIETALSVAKELAKSPNVTYLPGGSGNSLLLNVSPASP